MKQRLRSFEVAVGGRTLNATGKNGDEWPSLSSACMGEGEIDECIQESKRLLDEVGKKAKRKLRSVIEEAKRKPLL